MLYSQLVGKHGLSISKETRKENKMFKRISQRVFNTQVLKIHTGSSGSESDEFFHLLTRGK